MLAWGLPSGVSGACDNTLIPEWRCPVKRPSQDPGEHRANGINVHTSICDLHPTRMKTVQYFNDHDSKAVITLPQSVSSVGIEHILRQYYYKSLLRKYPGVSFDFGRV